jgi:hypothetical protein
MPPLDDRGAGVGGPEGRRLSNARGWYWAVVNVSAVAADPTKKAVRPKPKIREKHTIETPRHPLCVRNYARPDATATARFHITSSNVLDDIETSEKVAPTVLGHSHDSKMHWGKT